MNATWPDIFTAGLMICLGFVMLLMVVLLGTTLYADSGCKEAGWTKGESTLTLDLYCYSRINGSDVVLPYESALDIGHPHQFSGINR